MKRIFFLLTLSLSIAFAQAQRVEDMKNLVVLKQYKTAKTEVDKAMANAKFAAKPEAQMLKSVVYAGLAMDNSNKGTSAADDLAMEGDAAFQKYRQGEPALTLVTDPVYQEGPINLYSNFYASGYNDYADKKWQKAFEKLKRAVDYSDLLIEKKCWGSLSIPTY